MGFNFDSLFLLCFFEREKLKRHFILVFISCLSSYEKQKIHLFRISNNLPISNRERHPQPFAYVSILHVACSLLPQAAHNLALCWRKLQERDSAQQSEGALHSLFLPVSCKLRNLQPVTITIIFPWLRKREFSYLETCSHPGEVTAPVPVPP